MILSHGATGLFLIDKPTGITSHDVVDRVRRITGERRVGHAGTLDPLASGLLIALVGREWTKRQAEFLHLDKTYECSIRLGITTDTHDLEGQATSEASWEAVTKISQPDAEKALIKFTGKIQQQVPLFSAVKVKGKILHRAARRAQRQAVDLDIELPVKSVEIFSLQLTE